MKKVKKMFIKKNHITNNSTKYFFKKTKKYYRG